MFCWFCSARLLRLSLDRSWANVHPSRKQSQPPAYTIRQNLVSFALLGAVGCRILAFCGNSAEAGATRRFLSRKVHLFRLKNRKEGRFWQKACIFRVFCGILGKILKGRDPSPDDPDCVFSVLRAHPRSCRPFPLHTDKFVCSCRLVSFWCCHTHPTTESNPNCVFWSELMRVCGWYAFFLSV